MAVAAMESFMLEVLGLCSKRAVENTAAPCGRIYTMSTSSRTQFNLYAKFGRRNATKPQKLKPQRAETTQNLSKCDPVSAKWKLQDIPCNFKHLRCVPSDA